MPGTRARVVGVERGDVVVEVDPIGTGKVDDGTDASALDAKICQIRAGNVPPSTVMRVRGGFISTRFDSGSPTQTAATSSGVYPTNQASVLFSALPVLPATGRPMRALIPVPRCTTCCSTPVTVR